MKTKSWRVQYGGRHPMWTFIAGAKLLGMDRAMLTTMWFLLGEKWL